ncbi:MAG: universal stress protein [Dehalococcoidia bacterium]
MFERMMVCLDGSPLAEQVIPCAREEASHFGARLVLLQVVRVASDMVSVENPEMVVDNVPEVPVEEKEALDYLESVAGPLRRVGLDVECAVTRESVSTGKDIINFATEKSIDLIIMSTHGRGGLSRMLFGSVAEVIMSYSRLPMLVIRPRE